MFSRIRLIQTDVNFANDSKFSICRLCLRIRTYVSRTFLSNSSDTDSRPDQPDLRPVVPVPLVLREGHLKEVCKQTYFVFLRKKYVHSYSFYLLGSVNKLLKFCVLSLLVFKNDHYNFSQPCCSCRICVYSGFPKFWWNDIWKTSFPGTRWYVVAVWADSQMVRHQKLFGNHSLRQTT